MTRRSEGLSWTERRLSRWIRNRWLVLLVFFALSIPTSGEPGPRRPQNAGPVIPPTDVLTRALLDQGVSPAEIMGLDAAGVPILCGTAFPSAGTARASGAGPEAHAAGMSPASSAALPAGTRGWETIPGVIRDDGVESFYLEVDVNGPVNRVSLTIVYSPLRSPQAAPFDLRDDGAGGDRVAGDFVFTAGPFTYETSAPLSAGDRSPNGAGSPPVLGAATIGEMVIEETDGTTTEFLLRPVVGILYGDSAPVTTLALAPNVVIAPHLINVRTSTRETQRDLRQISSNLANLTRPIYEVLPDTIHELILFSTCKIELLPRLSRTNFNAGIHQWVRVNHTGTGLTPFDSSGLYGSHGVLTGYSILDAYDRGNYSGNATHELTHSWAALVHHALGLNPDGFHWSGRSNAGSAVGGMPWTDNGDGSFTIDCTVVNGGLTQAPPIDRYLAGFLDGADVPPMRVYSDASLLPLQKCQTEGGIIRPEEITLVHPISDIQAYHGVRTPGPATSQKLFRIAFVAESHDRLLNPTEMTYYETLADLYTKEVPPGDPAPPQGFNWVSMARYWGPNAVWRGEILTDLDHDGVTDDIDCNNSDPTVWSVPGEVTGLLLSPVDANPGAPTALSWNPPSTGGVASAMLYDTLRSASPQDFVQGTLCLETDDPGTQALDAEAPPPGAAFFYLVRPQNSCGPGPLALAPDGSPRPGITCP